MTPQVFTEDVKLTPYWWDDVPRPKLPEASPPATADVVIIGSGYTGLSAALQTTRGGRHVVVLDAEDAGWGCSTRNGGQGSTSLKPSFSEPKTRHAEVAALGIRREGLNALEWIGDFISRERIDCDFHKVGRFHAAHNAAAYESLGRSAADQPKGLKIECHLIPRAQQRSEIGSDLYHGGLLYPTHASLHPGKFHQGLLDRVRQAGAVVLTHCPVEAVDRDGDGFRLRTSRGTMQAREAIIANHGHSTGLTPAPRCA